MQFLGLFVGFKTEEDLLDFFTDQTGSYTTLCGLVFSADSLDSNGNLRQNTTVSYKIRLRAEGYNGTYGASSFSDTSSNWQTDVNYAFQLRPGPQGDMYGGRVPGECSEYLHRLYHLSLLSLRLDLTRRIWWTLFGISNLNSIEN